MLPSAPGMGQVYNDYQRASNTRNAQARPQTALRIDDVRRLHAAGNTSEDWPDARTSDTTMVICLISATRESLAEMERLASLLDMRLRACHDPHSAASPQRILDDYLQD